MYHFHLSTRAKYNIGVLYMYCNFIHYCVFIPLLSCFLEFNFKIKHINISDII